MMFSIRKLFKILIMIFISFNPGFLYGVPVPIESRFPASKIQVTSAMSQMTQEIVSRYFSKSRCILVVVEEPNEGENVEDYIPGSLQRFSVHFREEMVDYKLVEDIMLKALDEKCLAYIFMVSDPVQIVMSMKMMYRKTKQRANGKFLFLPKGSGFESAIDNVLQMREMDFFPDLVMAIVLSNENAVVSSSTNIELVTHKFSGMNTNRESIVLDTWTQKLDTNEGRFLLSANIYPDKVSNLMGKSLTASTFTYQPYAILDLEASPIILDGTETRIFLEFCKWVNATFRVSIVAEDQWGEIYENFTGIGLLGIVAEDRADLGYAAIYLWSYEYQFVDYTIPYIRTGITCIAPRPKLLPGWLTAVLPFTLSSWTAVLSSIVAAALSLYFVTKATELVLGGVVVSQGSKGRYSTMWNCVFNSLGLFVLQTPPDERTTNRLTGPSRHVLVWLTIMFLLITTSYGSGLASILTVPRFQPPIETVSDLAYSSFHWGATHPAWTFSLREDRDPRTLLLLSHFQVLKESSLNKHAAVGDLAFSIERLPAGHYAIGEYVREIDVSTRLRLMKEDIYHEHVSITSPKGSPYMTKLNKLIFRLIESGLFLKWEEEVVTTYLDTRLQRAISHSRDSVDLGPTKLQMRHIEGGVYLLGLGLALSFLAFIAELIYYKCSMKMTGKITRIQK